MSPTSYQTALSRVNRDVIPGFGRIVNGFTNICSQAAKTGSPTVSSPARSPDLAAGARHDHRHRRAGRRGRNGFRELVRCRHFLQPDLRDHVRLGHASKFRRAVGRDGSHVHARDSRRQAQFRPPMPKNTHGKTQFLGDRRGGRTAQVGRPNPPAAAAAQSPPSRSSACRHAKERSSRICRARPLRSPRVRRLPRRPRRR